MLNFENLDRFNPIGNNVFNIPEIRPTSFNGVSEWQSFNFCLTDKHSENKGIHFFIDDYQFLRVWKNPQKYISMLQKYKYVLSPDFSMYTDMPKALQIYNHYRKHWCAAYWQENGIDVIPTICWGDKDSLAWCFDGEPHNSVVAVSNVGCMKNRSTGELFLRGYNKMLEVLNPTQIIFFGNVMPEYEGNIINIPPYYDKIRMLSMKKGRCNYD